MLLHKRRTQLSKEFPSRRGRRLNMVSIKATSIEDAWFQCLDKVLTQGHEYTIERGSFVGHKRRELDYITVELTYPRSRPLAPICPEGVLSPTSEAFIEEYLETLITTTKDEHQQYTYGQDIAPQIQEVINMCKAAPNTNQACMSVGSKESINLPDPQCLRVIDIRFRYGKLHFIVYFRSWDLWAGFPTNLGGLQLMKEFMASEIGCEDGEIIAASKGLHLYEYTWEFARHVCGL